MKLGRSAWPWAVALMLAGDPAYGGDHASGKWIANGFLATGSAMSETGASFLGGGGGAQRFLWRGLGLGADVSGYRDNYYRAVGTFGHVGIQTAYHFREDERALEPFVLFGVGSYFSKGSRASLHGGGGLIYWLRPRLGLRLEFRAASRPYGDNVDGIFRIGISIR